MIPITEAAVFTTIFAILVVIVNILTQIFKSFKIKSELPTRVFVLLISIILTVLTFIAACQIYNIPLMWYSAAASVIIGVIVAYCAMFGYDNLYGELKNLFYNIFKNSNKEGNDNE